MADELDTLPKNKMSLSALKRGELIAEGGFAQIFKARTPKHGQVVLRLMKKKHRFNRKLRGRFLQGVDVRRECGQHPNIISYIGEGGSLFSLPFEVSEFVNGKDLKILSFQKHPKIISQPLQILRQCAAAMMHIHQIGFLHLDIKPENYLVSFDNGEPEVKLTDFDLCLPVDSTEAPRNFGGSMAYLPPEYLATKKVSIGTDIFAFGVMAYHLCTGQMPFVGSVEALRRNGRYQVTFPNGNNPVLTERVRNFIITCLAETPDKRFRDGGELFVNLEQVVREDAKDAQRARMGI